MGLSRRKFTRKSKIAALRRLEAGASIAEVARACEINLNLLHRWRNDFQHSAEHAFPGLGKRRADDHRVAELEENRPTGIGDRFFEKVLITSKNTGSAGMELKAANYREVQQKVSGKLAIEQHLLDGRSEPQRLLSVRPGARARGPRYGSADVIQRIALEMPSYGRLRITAELKRRGWIVNHKRVQRIMREDNLLCLRRRKFVVATTESRHDLRIYRNLARKMTLSGAINVDDPHRSHPAGDRVLYLAVVRDAFSRKVIGWAVDRTLEVESSALRHSKMALAKRQFKARAGPSFRPRRTVRLATNTRAC